VTGPHLLDPGSQCDFHALVLEDLGDVAVGLAGERLEQGVPVVDQRDPCLAGVDLAVLAGNGHLDHVAQRAGDLDARGPAAHHDHVERAALHERRIALDLLEQAKDAGA